MEEKQNSKTIYQTYINTSHHYYWNLILSLKEETEANDSSSGLEKPKKKWF